MKHIGMLPIRFDVESLARELEACPDEWDSIRLRTSHPMSPHREISDIWVRYNASEKLTEGMSVEEFNGPHESVWYPVAEKLPSVKTIASQLMEHVQGERLGGILITRIPAGKEVYPHVDRGWHAEHYEKFGIQVKGDPNQAFCFEDGELSARDGEAYWFHNTVPHWVRNQSDRERITLIVTLRRSH
jgi:hypothetical protein